MPTRDRRLAHDPPEQPDDGDDRGRVDVAPPGLVVERDVAADDRDGERLAGLRHAVDRLRELPHHLGVLRIAEVQAVHEGERDRAGARDVERRLGDGRRGTGPRVDGAPPGVPVDTHRERLALPGKPGGGELEDRGVPLARADHRVQEQLVVVLAVDGSRVGEELQQVPARVRGRGQAARGRRRAARRGPPAAPPAGRSGGRRRRATRPGRRPRPRPRGRRGSAAGRCPPRPVR